MRPLKRFSQNFLTNPFYQKKIVDALNIQAGDMVLEIGPGQGALTGHLVKKTCKKRLAVELDQRMVEHLKTKFGNQLEIIQADILTVDLCGLSGGQRLKIVGNLPYHITSPILFHLIDHYQCVSLAVLMTQKEVGRRICAEPGSKEYGILSVMTQTFASVRFLFDIKRGNFFPVPKVDSSVISLSFFERISRVDDLQLFRKIVRSSFNFRRKTLKNSLSRIFDEKVLNSLDQSFLQKRPEQLTVDDFKYITNLINKVLNNETH